MSNHVSKDIDDQIREALRREDAELLEHFRGELPVHEQLIATFQGRARWLNLLAFAFTFVGLAIVGVAVYRFFHAEDMRDMIAWAACFLWGVLWVAMLKIWFWMEIHKNAVTREIKRLELQIASLSRQLAQGK